MKTYRILAVLAIVLLCTEAAIVHGDDKGGSGKGNNGNGDGNGNNGKNNGVGSNGKDNGFGTGNGNNGKGNSGKDDDKNGKGDDDKGKGNNGKGDDDKGKGNNGKGDDDKGKGNNGKGDEDKGKGNNGKGDDDKGKGKGKCDGTCKDELDYDELSPSKTGCERAYCKAKGACNKKTLQCPAECPSRKPKNNKKQKGCHVNCSSKCEATCKWRKPKCDGYGSLCYDPRFVGGDGVMFYFHGAKDGNFAIVSDDKLQINAHFIGTRPQGRTRDYTWVQALSVMFDTHTLVIAANKVSHWDDNVDALTIRFNGEAVNVPYDGESEWRNDQVLVERTDDKNSVHVKVFGLVEMDIRVRPIGKQENKVHNYQLPSDDAFAHLETQFKFANLSDGVEGVLGKTYQPDYVSPVKRGVPMPMMGGEDKYQTSSLFSTFCNACRFKRPSEFEFDNILRLPADNNNNH